MTVSLSSQLTGSFGGISFPYGFAYDGVANVYYVAHASINTSGAQVNPATDDTLQTAVTALQSIETSTTSGQAASLTQLQDIVAGLSGISTATGQASALTQLQAIATAAAAGPTAEAQASALTQLQAIAASVASGSTATLQTAAITALNTIANDLTRTLTYTDKSGTCSATANTFTQITPPNTARGYFRVSNPNGAGTLYVYDKATGTPTLTNTIQIDPGSFWEFTTRCSNAAIQIAGSLASLAFEAAEGQ